jgi:hypothetical protein
MSENSSIFKREVQRSHMNRHSPAPVITMYDSEIAELPVKGKSLYELSCNILSLSFLEDDEDIYTMDDLREKF